MPIITKAVAVLLLFMAIPFLFQGRDMVWLDVSVVVDGHCRSGRDSGEISGSAVAPVDNGEIGDIGRR